jgi:putative transposase
MTDSKVSIVVQCELANVCRATYYGDQHPRGPDEEELLYLALIDEEYTKHPFYGSRKMVAFLCVLGHIVNRKRVQRLMRILCLAGIAPGPNTSRAHPEHKVYPYLLRGMQINRPNQVWGTDISAPQQAA